MHRTVSGYILKQYDIREYDRFFVFYTEQYGKIRCNARGIKKMKSKLAGYMRPFARIAISTVPAKESPLIIGAEVEIDYFDNQYSYRRAYTAGKMLSLIDAVTQEGEHDHQLFGLLEDGLRFLGESSHEDVLSLIYYRFVSRIFAEIGVLPEMNRCANCGKDSALDKQHSYFSRGMEFWCHECAIGRDGISLTAPVLSFLQGTAIELTTDEEKTLNTIYNIISETQLGVTIDY